MMGCSNCKRFREYDDYCSQHENCCKTSNCDKRIPSSQEYCTQHSNPCLRRNCNIGIIDRENFCYNCSIIHNNRHYSYQCSVTYFCTYSSCSTKVSIGGDYCPYHQNQITEQNQLKSLVQQKTSLSNPQEVTRFTTWWNNNLATVVNYNSGYWVFLVVYDKEKTNNSGQINWNREVFVFPPDVSRCSSQWGEYSRQQHSSLTTAQNEANWLRGALDGENPILYVHPFANSYEYFSSLITSPYVIKRCLPTEVNSEFHISMVFITSISVENHRYPSNPDSYLKPLDIVKVKCRDRIPNTGFSLTGREYFYHVGIYLGKIDGEYKVCDFSKKVNGIRVHSWEKFLDNATGELIGYHPIIPFKNYQKIARQIAWAEEKRFREKNYDLCNRNCEHLANMLGYGINYSEQIEDKKDIISAVRWGTLMPPNQTINNNKGSTIKLTNEISESNDELDSIVNDLSKEIERRYLQEVPTTSNCQIM